jgi:hypothetical protein
MPEVTYNEFTNWLFPGDDISRARNPDNIPPEILPLLEEVQCKTGVPLEWLQRTAGLVIDGLAGAQCLWFLHGASGTLETQEEVESREWVFDALRAPKAAAAKKLRKQIERRPDNDGSGSLNIDVRWTEGLVNEEQYATEDDWMAGRPSKVRTTKLGKWLRKHGASSELRHAFETRELPTWDWEISAHPYDILTMSFERPWTSCMRPPSDDDYIGGEAQYGPLTDMAAGSAILFFYRPGAKVPCGRLLLRPAASPDGVMLGIFGGGRTYGCGPDLSAEQLSEMLEPHSSITVYRHLFCPYGRKGAALTRHIYSDTDHEFCEQTDEQYDAAYDALVEAPWPEPRLSMEDAWAVASEFQGQLDTSLAEEDEEFEYPIDEMATNFVHNWFEDNYPQIGAMHAYARYSDQIAFLSDVASYVLRLYPDIPEYIITDVDQLAREYFLDELANQMNWEVPVVLAFSERTESGLPITTYRERQNWGKLFSIYTRHELDRFYAQYPHAGSWITDALTFQPREGFTDEDYNLFIVMPKSVFDGLEHLPQAAIEIAEADPGDATWTASDLE